MRVLVVAAHPDDETLGAGGTMARHARHGDEVWACVLTDGRAPHGAAECTLRAADVLGVKKVVFLGFTDQRLDERALLDVIQPIEQLVADFQPDVVYTHFGNDVNQDHRVVFNATMVATRPGSGVRRVLSFEAASSTEWAPPFGGNVFAPSVYVDITETLQAKIDAMRCYSDARESEVRPYPHPRSYEAIEVYAKRHGIESGLAAAEAFMLVREVVTENEETADGS
ncbi:MAG TPA: PIG-L deacetylase family protein [Actinomycetota bacterium]|nr:PIG-L deacetylase family protein [Actinomycetota bacterium]